MYIVDDPILALLARFLGDASHPELSDEQFLRQQVAEIEAYVERFPAHERQANALAWIEANASKYRLQWQKRAAIDVLAETRCADCPLSGGNEHAPCAIHVRWLKLLRRYAAGELSSHEYAERSLALLTAHKDRLKVSQYHASLRPARPDEICSA